MGFKEGVILMYAIALSYNKETDTVRIYDGTPGAKVKVYDYPFNKVLEALMDRSIALVNIPYDSKGITRYKLKDLPDTSLEDTYFLLSLGYNSYKGKTLRLINLEGKQINIDTYNITQDEFDKLNIVNISISKCIESQNLISFKDGKTVSIKMINTKNVVIDSDEFISKENIYISKFKIMTGDSLEHRKIQSIINSDLKHKLAYIKIIKDSLLKIENIPKIKLEFRGSHGDISTIPLEIYDNPFAIAANLLSINSTYTTDSEYDNKMIIANKTHLCYSNQGLELCKSILDNDLVSYIDYNGLIDIRYHRERESRILCGIFDFIDTAITDGNKMIQSNINIVELFRRHKAFRVTQPKFLNKVYGDIFIDGIYIPDEYSYNITRSIDMSLMYVGKDEENIYAVSVITGELIQFEIDKDCNYDGIFVLNYDITRVKDIVSFDTWFNNIHYRNLISTQL